MWRDFHIPQDETSEKALTDTGKTRLNLFANFKRRFSWWTLIGKNAWRASYLNPIPTRLWGAPKTKGGHIVPPSKNPVTFSESIQVKFFWKLLQKWVSWPNFRFHGNHGWRFEVVHRLQIFDWESLFKMKTVFSKLKVNKSNFLWKLVK